MEKQAEKIASLTTEKLTERIRKILIVNNRRNIQHRYKNLIVKNYIKTNSYPEKTNR